MKKAIYVLLSIMLLGGVYSCTDDTIGSSISGTQMEIVADSSFQIKGSSIENKAVLTRTMTQLLGAVKASNYGELTSDFVSQFLSSRDLDTTGMSAAMIDSVKLIFRMPLGGYTGDSIVPMRLNVYKLDKQLETPINSSFNPAGYYSKGDLLGSTSYTATKYGAQKFLSGYIASQLDTASYRSIVVKMPKSLGVSLFNEYVNNPSTFASAENFAKFFPGIYVTTSYGSGRVVKIDKNFLFLNFRRKLKNTTSGNDTIVKDSMSFASAAPEVITNNNIKLQVAESIKKMVSNGNTIMQAPTGYDIAVKFPVQEIIDKYNSDNNLKVLNNIIFEIPAESIENECNIAPPKYILLIKTSEKDSFFQNNKIADNVSSFYATYNSTTKKYVFSEMRGLILDILKGQNGIATADDINFTLTPIDVTTESSSNSYYQTTTTITSMTPAVSGPSIAKLNLDKSKIKMVYSKQLLKN